jgi:hypothetical protein
VTTPVPTPPEPTPRSVLIGWSATDAAETQRLIELLTAEDPYHRVPNRTEVYRYARRAVLLDLVGQRADFSDPSDAYLAEYLSLLSLVREVQRQPQAATEDVSDPETLPPSRTPPARKPKGGGT